MRVRQGDLGQVHVKEGRATVLRDNRSMVLSDVATTILMSTSPTSLTSLDEITTTVVTKLGPPAPPLEAEDLVRGLIDELVAHDLLIREGGDEPTGLSVAIDNALRDALRNVVSPESGTWVPSPQFDSAALLAAAHRHRVTSVLGLARTRLVLPRALDEQLDVTYRQESGAIRLLERELVEAVEALTEAGIRVLALEGLALAVQAHGHVTARGTDDHDLLVTPSDLEAAVDVLTSLGWRLGTGFPPPGPTSEWQDFVRDFAELPLTRRGSAIDLRWQLPATDGTNSDFDALWERRTAVTIGVADVPTLSPHDALVHAVGRQTTNHPSRLRDLLDVWLLAALPGTWEQPDLVLSNAQLQVIGEAVRAFGTPAGAADSVHEAARLAYDAMTTGE